MEVVRGTILVFSLETKNLIRSLQLTQELSTFPQVFLVRKFFKVLGVLARFPGIPEVIPQEVIVAWVCWKVTY